MTQFFETSDGLSLAYKDQGSGLPIIALSGLTRNMKDFNYVAPHLQDIRLIRMDYRGRGQSDWADPKTYTVQTESNDVISLMDHLNLPQAAILGTSRGGLIGMGLAAFAPDRVFGLCLNDIGPVIDKAGLDLIRGHIGVQPTQKTYAEAAAYRARNQTAFVDVPMERWMSEVKALYIEDENGLSLRYDPDLKQQFLNLAQELPDLWPVFDLAAKKPLATIRGANSDILSVATMKEMCRRAPQMINAVVPNRGHVPFLDEAEALNALHQWLGKMR